MNINGKIQDLFGLNKIDVLASSSLAEGVWQFDAKNNVLVHPDDNADDLVLAGDFAIAKIERQSEQQAKNWLIAAGFGAAGLIAGPLGVVLGVMLGGNRHAVCALVTFHSGVTMLATMDVEIYKTLLARTVTKPVT